MAKFIPGLDGVSPPLAGIEGSTRRAFLAYDFVGSFLWTALYVGLGYLFAARLTIIAASMARVGGLIAVGIGIPMMCYVGWRVWIMIHMLRHLRLRRMTPLLLSQLIASGEPIAIIDLLDFEDEREERAGIPGALRMAPSRLRGRSSVGVPEHLEMVLYCSSLGELISARVALALQKKGISNVWVLDGGLTAWKREGLPVTRNLANPKDAAERFGIRVIENPATR